MPLSAWSVRTLATQLVRDEIVTTIHYSSVCLVLQDADLQPHRTLYWKLGYDPDFDRKAQQVLWYYANAPRLAAAREPVFCIDEKPGIQLLARPHADLPPRPGCPRRREFEYVRLGTGLLVLLVNLVTGKFFSRTPSGKSSGCFTGILEAHLRTLPKAKRVHYILDNDSTHKSAETRAWAREHHQRVRLHYTPKYASWLDQAEIALGNFTRYYLRNKVWTSTAEFAPHVQSSTAHYNRDFAHPFDWSFTRNKFREWRNRSATFSTGP